MAIPAIIVVVTGSFAVIITTPVEAQVATPFMSMVAIMALADIHVSPSVGESIRLVPSSNLPMAVNVTVGMELPMELPIEAVTVDGVTAILINFG